MEENYEWESCPPGVIEDEEDWWIEPPEPPKPYHWASFRRKIQHREREVVVTNKLGQLLDMPHSTVVDAGHSTQFTQKFIAETDGDIFYGKIPIMVSEADYTLKQVIDKIKEPLSEARAVMPYDEQSIVIRGDYGVSPLLIWVGLNVNRRTGIGAQGVHDLNVQIISHHDVVEAMKKHLSDAFKEVKLAEIKWWTQGERGHNSREIYLPKNNTRLLPEFYPDLGDPAKYIADYIAADESVLLIAGPPGTGKTTLLRHMIFDHKLSAHVIYDETLMQKDALFQSFLFEDHGDIMIIEDADTILNSREQDNNRLMSRFLNVSDGLIKLPNKKLVFTTNITDFSKVDPALLRPGRCFGVMHTRPLNLVEAQAAARVANLPIPMANPEKREYTIAELFNNSRHQKIRTIGFGIRH